MGDKVGQGGRGWGGVSGGSRRKGAWVAHDERRLAVQLLRGQGSAASTLLHA